MSLIGNRVLLGYEDEAVSEKYRDQVDYTTNKIGGLPNWTGDAPTAVTCKLCGLNLPLVLQIYAPLSASPYHRTLYIFACINPNCWNQNGSWVCLRSQILAETNESKTAMSNEAVGGQTDMWNLTGADNWGDEENGNVVDLYMTSDAAQLTQGMNDLIVDERNANSGASAAEGAMGCAPMATAIIEGGDEAEVVTIDSPITPRDNIIALLEEAAPMPQVPISSLRFASAFISVAEEDLTRLGSAGLGSPSTEEHIRELMNSCKINEEMSSSMASGGGSNGRLSPAEENYEKSLPAHGDKLFFQFVSRIQANPGQILRYGGYPLLLYPMPDKPNVCKHCGGQLLYEMQILPTLLSRLKLVGSNFEGSNAHLEFGSVYLFSCGASCWDSRDSYREEQLVVQMEKI